VPEVAGSAVTIYTKTPLSAKFTQILDVVTKGENQMTGARSLIAAFTELNRSENKTVAHFTPSLIGMFGSASIFDSFLMEVDSGIAAGALSASLKKRTVNLIGTFIPQVADYNNVENPASFAATAEDLKNIAADSLENRRRGVEIILSALLVILKEANEI
jgi:hypothetical protein